MRSCLISCTVRQPWNIRSFVSVTRTMLAASIRIDPTCGPLCEEVSVQSCDSPIRMPMGELFGRTHFSVYSKGIYVLVIFLFFALVDTEW